MRRKNDSVLLLNASYEPVGLISIQRAICLNYLDKVYVEEYNNEITYRSPSAECKVPSVVRLKHFIDIRTKRRLTATKRNRIYIRDKYKCSYCGVKGNAKELTLDHVIPKCRGGKNIPENLVSCCFPCNQKKRDHLLEECGMKLLHPPKHLKTKLDKVVINHWGMMRPSWAKYLFLSNEGDSSYND